MLKLKQIAFMASMITVIFSGCTPVNTYQKYYKDSNTRNYSKPNLDSNIEITTNLNFDDIEKNRKEMYENDYSRIGFSSFQGSEVHSSEEHIKQLAEQLQAKKVLEYVKSLGQVNSGSISTYVGYGVSMNTPIVANRFEYFAEFYQIAKKRVCGCQTKNLSDELKKQIGSNKGVVVIGIVKKSPAYEFNLLSGDIITKVNDIQIDDQKHFGDIIDKFQGTTAIFYIYRDGKYITLNITLNKSEE